jgi:glutamate racemase
MALRDTGTDTLILGCTHYPLLRGVISKIMGAGVALIDSGAETAKLAAGDIRARGMLSPGADAGTIRFFITDSVEGFSALASQYLESDVRGMVEQVTLEN